MEIQQHIKLILILQLFWFSFPLIGLAEANLFRLLRLKRLKESRRKSFCQNAYLLNCNPLVAFLLLFAVGLGSLSIIIVPSYFFSLSITILEGGYLFILLLSILFHIYHSKSYWAWIKDHDFTRKDMWAWSLIVAVFLGFDYYIALKSGAPISYDAPLQISKINLFTNGQLSFTDPYFGRNGVFDPRYSTNLVNAVEALATTLFHTTAIKVWYYSGAFFRLLLSISLFALAWEYLGTKVKHWAYVVLPVAAFMYTIYFQYAEIPDRIALTWTALLLVAIKVWYERKQVGFLLLACLLISCTHAINALTTIVFLSLLWLGLVIMRSASKRQLLELALAILILLPPLLLQLAYPNHIVDDKLYFNAKPISGLPLVFHNYGSLRLLTIHLPFSLVTGCVFGGVLILTYCLKFIRGVLFRMLSFLAVIIGVVLSYSPALLGVAGWVYLYRSMESKALKTVLVLLLLYFGLLVYDPIFLHFAANRVPPWLISRFGEFNMLAFITPIVGVVALCLRGPLVWSYHRLGTVAVYLVVLMLFWIMLLHQMVDLRRTAFETQNYTTNQALLEGELAGLQTIKSELRDQTVFMDSGNPLFLPTIVKANTLSMGWQLVNGAPMSNTARRNACSSQIYFFMKQSDLQAAGITVVLFDNQANESLKQLISSRPYLVPEPTTSPYAVYKVSKNPWVVISPSNVCAIPYGE